VLRDSKAPELDQPGLVRMQRQRRFRSFVWPRGTGKTRPTMDARSGERSL